MLIKYELYRSKNLDELIEQGKIRVDIQTETQLQKIDEVILGVLDTHINQLDIIKRYGRAYLGKVSLIDLEITDDDTGVDLNEEGFNFYISHIIPNLSVIWSKTTNDISNK